MLSGRFGEGWTLYVAHLNPVIVPITQMRDIMFGTDSNIPDFGYGIWIGFVLTVVVFGTMIFQNRAHKGGGWIMKVLTMDDVVLTYPQTQFEKSKLSHQRLSL